MTQVAYRALIDGQCDVLVYRAGFAADSQVLARLREEIAEKWPEMSEPEVKDMAKMWQAQEEYVAYALGNVRSTIETLLEGRQDFRLFLSGPGNYRETVATLLPYKGNRDPTHKPKYYKEIKEYMVERWKAEIVEGMEADDAIAMAQWAARDKSTVICSIDKDLLMIPGYHYNIRHKEQTYQTLDEANACFFRQMLIGDSTDNIPGIKGIGVKRAAAAVDPYVGDTDAMKEVVWQMYVRQYQDNAATAWNEVARLLWMSRERPDDCPFLV